MRIPSWSLPALLIPIGITSACSPERPGPSAPERDAALYLVGQDAFGWSEPVWLGPVVNSAAREWRPTLSSDGLRLYFHSNREPATRMDIYVSYRASPNCPWQAAVNLGPPLNTARDDGDPAFTPDGRVVFYSSDEGHPGFGRGDLFISRRADPADDFAWEPPVNLGSEVNTAAHESSPTWVASEDGGTLYFGRSSGIQGFDSDIYKVRVSRDGVVSGAATLVTEFSAPAPTGPNAPHVSADGREMIFYSGGTTGTRPGSVGLADIWVSHRRSVNDPWSDPENIGTPVNSAFADLAPTISQDGSTIFFTSAEARGGLGLQDMWMSTRGPRPAPVAAGSTECGS